MKKILIQMKRIKRTVQSGNYPNEMLPHINKKYRDLENELKLITN